MSDSCIAEWKADVCWCVGVCVCVCVSGFCFRSKTTGWINKNNKKYNKKKDDDDDDDVDAVERGRERETSVCVCVCERANERTTSTSKGTYQMVGGGTKKRDIKKKTKNKSNSVGFITSRNSLRPCDAIFSSRILRGAANED